ncbi:hypothetical protein, partial [Helicobacter pylori]|uniref:hypothetical protein n=1 Tax=Helicobacter pylori TaxID=210 RepID=UPI001BAEF440
IRLYFKTRLKDCPLKIHHMHRACDAWIKKKWIVPNDFLKGWGLNQRFLVPIKAHFHKPPPLLIF